MNKHVSTEQTRVDDRQGAGSVEDQGPGMTCSSCGRSELVEGRISTVFRSGDEWAVIRDIPAMVCPNCQEELIDDATAVRLDMMRANGFSLEEASETMTVPVFTFPSDSGRLS